MSIDPQEVKKLRELTGAGMMDAKAALEEAAGDSDKAIELLRVKGLAKAGKKADRETSNGLIEAYVHGGKIGVLVEVNCETDFVARTDEFKNFVRDIAMHVAATAPEYVTSSDVPADRVAAERRTIEAEVAASGKPAEHAKKIVDGKLEKYLAQICLSDQAFVKDPNQTISELTKSMIAKLGENIVISKFSRLELGT